MLPFYRLSISEFDNETGIDFNALVDMPAHQKGFIAFNKDIQKYEFNDEQRIVTGVMISAETPIYRRDAELGEHYVFFDEKAITTIKNKFHKKQFQNNVNLMHDASQVQEGVYMISSYQIGGDKNPSTPIVFANQNLKDGTWIASYKIDNDEVWAKVKNGEFAGFSVEGNFFKDLIKTKTNMNKKSKTIFELMFGSKKPAKIIFATATTTDGVVLSWEGDLVEGIAVLVELEGEQVPAPEGDYQITLEDGSVKVITVDSTGMVVTIVDEQAMENEAPADDIKTEVAEVMKEILADVNERFNLIEQENESLKAEIVKLKEVKASKFDKEVKTVETKKVTIAEILKSK